MPPVCASPRTRLRVSSRVRIDKRVGSFLAREVTLEPGELPQRTGRVGAGRLAPRRARAARSGVRAGVTGALDGLRVLELTHVMAGPFCGQVLADMGADVIKVEPPEGDSTRRSLGFRMRGEDTAAFLAVNRNKRSLTLDLKSAEHQAVFHRLARDADVVLENYRP